METFAHKMTVKTEAGEKFDVEVALNMTGLDLEPFAERGLRDFLANSVKPIRDGDKTVAEYLEGVQADAEAYARREKRTRAAGEREPKIETNVVNNLADNVKRKKSAADIAAEGLPEVPLDKAGKPNYKAWAKEVITKFPDHAWVKKTKKAVEIAL